jgi:hypothetical protein
MLHSRITILARLLGIDDTPVIEDGQLSTRVWC